ncbi:MAG TPA: hypothetical protein VER39_16065 [Nocardioidaceae bacterium]|nr:hypothetical protein [Nocardioidaceae bacterium]
MAQSKIIEEETGTCRGWVHPHNGYYAGDFFPAHRIRSERGAAATRHLHTVGDPRGGTTTASSAPCSWREAA